MIKKLIIGSAILLTMATTSSADDRYPNYTYWDDSINIELPPMTNQYEWRNQLEEEYQLKQAQRDIEDRIRNIEDSIDIMIMKSTINYPIDEVKEQKTDKPKHKTSKCKKAWKKGDK